MLIEKPKIKNINNVDALREIRFYHELNIVKTVKAFKKYVRSYSSEIMKDKGRNTNDPLAQLEASKPVLKNVFRDLLIEMKDFKYQITLEVLLTKQKKNRDKEISTVYFNSFAKTVIKLNKYSLNQSFQQVLYRIDNWINEGSASTIEYMDGEYIIVSVYSPLSGSPYIEKSAELKHWKKGLINIKNNDNKCFLWCHIRHLNPLNKNPQRTTKANKRMANSLGYANDEFPVSKKIIKRLNKKIIFALMYSVSKMF